jgi:hypothetical protein
MLVENTGGTDLFLVRGDGNVGIGTTSPDTPLDVSSESSTIASFRATGGASNNKRLEIGSGGDRTIIKSFTDTTDAASALAFSNGNSEAMRIDSSGNVGINETNPGAKLDVVGDVKIGSFGTNTAELAFGTTIANKVFAYGAEFQTQNSDIQVVLGRNNGTSVQGTGGIGASSTNAFHVYDTTSVTKLFEVAQTSGNATFAGTIDSKAITALAKGAQLGTSGYYINSTFKDTGDNVGVFLAHNDTANGTGAIAGINQLAFLTYGSAWTQALLLDSNQNATFAGDVGIGVSPSQPLDVNGTALIRNTIYVGDDIQHWGDGGTGMFFGTDTISLKNDGGSTRLFVKSGGNVGIGETNPLYSLDVNSGADNTIARFLSSDDVGQIQISDNDTDTWIGSKNGLSYISKTAGTPVDGIVIDNSNNVGIGTITPSAKLDVNGGVRIADDTATASATNVGTLRYRADANNSHVDMCMQTGASTYEWINIVQNNW